jgi:hypothetical protein
MIDLWLRSGALAIVLVPYLVLYSLAAGLVWLTHLSPLRPFFASCIGITGPFFASVAVLFGLFSAFLANDVEHRNADMKAALFREADGVRSIMRLAEALGDAGKPLTAAVVAYVQSVLTQEWPAMTDRHGDREDLSAVRNLMSAVLPQHPDGVTSPAAQQALLQGLIEVRQARLARFTLARSTSDRMNWLAMLALGVLTQLAIAVVQLERLRPQALALFVFTTAFATTVVLIAFADRPASAGQLDAAPLRAAVASAMP